MDEKIFKTYPILARSQFWAITKSVRDLDSINDYKRTICIAFNSYLKKILYECQHQTFFGLKGEDYC